MNRRVRRVRVRSWYEVIGSYVLICVSECGSIMEIVPIFRRSINAMKGKPGEDSLLFEKYNQNNPLYVAHSCV
jgi:hypothetical protein